MLFKVWEKIMKMKLKKAKNEKSAVKAPHKKVLKRTETRKTAPKRDLNKPRVNLYPLGTKTQRRAIVEYLINRQGPLTGREMQTLLGVQCYTKRISEVNALTELTGVAIVREWLKVRTRWGNGWTRVANYSVAFLPTKKKKAKKPLTTKGKKYIL